MINILIKACLLFITYLFLYLTITVISEKKLKIDIKSLLCISGVILINVYIFKLTNGLLKGFVTFLGFYIYSRIGLSKSLKESIMNFSAEISVTLNEGIQIWSSMQSNIV